MSHPLTKRLARAWDPGAFLVDGVEELLTPCLMLLPERVEHNVRAVLDRLDGDASGWRVHVKTVKADAVVRQLLELGLNHMKCATPRELERLVTLGVPDVLLAHFPMGRNAALVAEIARAPGTRVSVLVGSYEDLAAWNHAAVDVFIDLDAGMGRTGVDPTDHARVASLARAAGTRFRGLHSYEGQPPGQTAALRSAWAKAGFARAAAAVTALTEAGLAVGELVTSGSWSFPDAIGTPLPATTVHRISPGTVVFNDVRTAEHLEMADKLLPAVAVLTRVVSRPAERVLTCDAGHKSLGVDAGVPSGVVLGHPELIGTMPSEEHLPLRVDGRTDVSPGDLLALVPKHVCPTVNLHEEAVVIQSGRIAGTVTIDARAHTPQPLLGAAAYSVAAAAL